MIGRLALLGSISSSVFPERHLTASQNVTIEDVNKELSVSDVKSNFG